MKINIILIFLLIFVSACEYELTVENNSSDDNTVQKEIRKDIKFTANSENVVETGEVFQLTYSVNENASNFTPPDFKDFDVNSGPFTSSSSSTQSLNGKSSRKVSNTYTYNISCSQPGTFILNPAEITIDDVIYKSNMLEIKVIGDSKQEKTKYANQNNNIKANEDVFLMTHYSKTNIYKGEHIIAETKIYTRKDFQNISEIQFPDYKGFWIEVLKAPRQVNFENEVINGKVYNSALLKQVLLFSQKPGNFTISPYEIGLQIKKKDGKTRDFFGNVVDNYKLINKKIRTKKQVITVRPLPPPIPDNFSGVTGKNIIVTGKIDNSNIKTDESTNLQITVSGNGNLYLLNELKLDLPEGIEYFKPQIEKTEKFSENGAFSEREFNYIIVGNNIGTYTIAPFSFVYFDTETEKYKTVSGSEIMLNVGKGSGYVPAENNSNIKNSKDIRFIQTNNLNLQKSGTTYAGSLLYWLTIAGLILVYIIFLIGRKKRIEKNKDVVKVKKKNASKVSQKRLKTALKYMNENNNHAFYKEILTSIWGYLSDKMSVNDDSLTNENIEHILKEKNVNDETITKLLNVIEICGYAQYGPSGEEGKPENIYKETSSSINSLEAYL